MIDNLRARWQQLEDEAIDRGDYFQMTAAGKSIDRGFIPLFDQHVRGRVLDAGAGRLAHRPLVAGSPNVDQYVSIDYEVAHPALSAAADLISGLPFREGTFDTVICSQVLEHVPDPKVALAELSRVLANDGMLLLSVPHISFVHGAPHDYYRYTQYGVSYLLREAGLVPVSVAPMGGLLSLLSTPASMGLLLASSVGAFHPTLRWIAQQVNRALIGSSRWLEARLDSERIFGLTIVAVARKPKGWSPYPDPSAAVITGR